MKKILTFLEFQFYYIKENMEEKLRPETLIFTGTARWPENVTSSYVYGFFSIDIEIDPYTDQIVDIACTLVPRLVEKVLCDCMVGYSFEEGVKNSIEKLEARFFSSTKRAIISAIEDAYKWYCRYKRKVEIEELSYTKRIKEEK